MHEFLRRLSQHLDEGTITPRQDEILRQFYRTYTAGLVERGVPVPNSPELTLTFLDLIISEIKDPYSFGFYHRGATDFADYLEFGVNMIRPLINTEASVLHGLDNFDDIEMKLAQGENCILFANHQTETDPQAIHIILKNTHEQLAANMLFVAGERVIADPIAVPFSRGRNMLCIHSKKYHESDEEGRAAKQHHNRRAMQALVEQLSEGGKCVYVAPSGGRDRPNESGRVELASLDPQAIDMFCLLARQSKRPTHYYPLALATHRLLAPPPKVEERIGEDREFYYTPIGVSLGKEIDFDAIPGLDDLDKREKRQRRGQHVEELLKERYDGLLKVLPKSVTHCQQTAPL